MGEDAIVMKILPPDYEDTSDHLKTVLFIGDCTSNEEEDSETRTYYVRNYDQIPISTITGVTSFAPRLEDLDFIFLALPVNEIILKNYDPEGAEDIDKGTILSVRWKGNVRGLQGTHFKNSITIDIWTGTKKISTKVSADKIQMCGSLSLDMCTEVSYHIKQHINDAIDFGHSVLEDPELFMSEIRYLIQYINDNLKTEDDTFDIEELYQAILTGEIEGVYLYEFILRAGHISTPDSLIELAEYFANILYGHETDSYIISQQYIPSNTVEIIVAGRAMLNKNYVIGFKIDLEKFARAMRERGYAAEYHNSLGNCATLYVYSDVPDDEYTIRRIRREKAGNKYSKHTIKVYRSGNIAHSGPGGEAMKDVYYNLMYSICDCADRIMSDI